MYFVPSLLDCQDQELLSEPESLLSEGKQFISDVIVTLMMIKVT